MFVSPLALPTVAAGTVPTFAPGAIVSNFGTLALVEAYDAERGYLLAACDDGSRWHATERHMRAAWDAETTEAVRMLAARGYGFFAALR